jgi:hypothetical protein
MGTVHAWFGARTLAVSGLLVLCAGCVINAPSSAPDKTAPDRSASAPVTSQRPLPTSPSTAPPTDGPTGRVPAPRTLTGRGTYAFSYQGAVGTIQVPASIMDPRLEPYGDYRRLAKGKPITYLIAQVDNQSDDTINMYEVVVVTNAGQQIEATSISDYVDTWRNSFAGGEGTEADAENFSRGIELSNASNFALLPGAKGTAILGAKEPITTVKRVFVYPAGPFDRVEARRIK